MSHVVTVDDYLQELEQMVKNAMKLPLSGGRVVLDGQNVEDILLDIRDAMPQECRQARAIVADRTKIIQDAKREAESIIRVAEEKARAMVSQNEIVKQAQQKANDLLNQTQQKCREMRRVSNEYVDDLMRRTDDALAANLSELRKTRQSIKATQRNASSR